jgi:hypothetical protein
MTLRDDIVRGLRVGSILLAAMLVGFAVYRMTHEPATHEPVKNEVATPTPEAAPAVTPAPVVVSATSSGTVPPPPPRVQRKRAAQSLVVETVPVARPVVQEAAAAAPEVKPEPVATPVEEKGTPAQTAEVKAEAEPGDDSTDAQQARSKRWVKAVGRFLHIGAKKDVPPQAIRQE